MFQHDVVIIGSGIAGMRCALEIKRQAPQADVALVSKLYPTRAPSVIERDGIAAALGNVRPDGSPSKGQRADADSVALHAADTLSFSSGLASQAAVQALCEAAPTAVYELEHMGLPFSRTSEGRIAQRKGWGHTAPRIAYSVDRTGHAIVHTLYGELVRYGIKVYPEWFVLGLAMGNGAVTGVTALDLRSGEVAGFAARATVLATGSYGRLFGFTSDTNSSTGDGLALAYAAGLPLRNLELVQYHPLGLYPTGFVISERVLLDGAVILNGSNQPIAKGQEVTLTELSVLLEQEIAAGRGAGPKHDHVWLDVRNLPANTVRTEYPQLVEWAKDYVGVDLFRELIPIRPTVGATLGGIPTNLDGAVLDAKDSPVQGLFAVGACAFNGAHGANQLPGNGLLEAVVFGKRTGAYIASQVKAKGAVAEVPAEAVSNAEAEINLLLRQTGERNVAAVRKQLWSSLAESAAVSRQSDLLSRQLGTLHDLRGEFNTITLGDKGRVFNLDLLEALELGRMLDWSEALVAGAQARQESRGVHVRRDFAATSQPQHVTLVRKASGTPDVALSAVSDAPKR